MSLDDTTLIGILALFVILIVLRSFAIYIRAGLKSHLLMGTGAAAALVAVLLRYMGHERLAEVCVILAFIVFQAGFILQGTGERVAWRNVRTASSPLQLVVGSVPSERPVRQQAPAIGRRIRLAVGVVSIASGVVMCVYSREHILPAGSLVFFGLAMLATAVAVAKSRPD